MRSDEEIERLLQDWLGDEARPMPHDVLEGALEAVARTAQTSPGGSPIWLRSRPLGWAAAFVVLILVLVAGRLAVDRIGSLSPTESPSVERPQTWDASADFGIATPPRNPGPDRYGNQAVWSYLRSSTAAHEPSTYVLLPDFSANAWNEPGLVNLFVGRLTAQDEGFLDLNPWSDGTHRRNAILGWTSPVSGRISIHGTVVRNQRSCSMPTGTVLFSIDRGSTSLKTISLLLGQSVSFEYTTTIGAGESLYFIVDAGPDAGCDLTYLRGLHIFYPPYTFGP